MNINTLIGTRIREAREAKGLSLAKAAGALGVEADYLAAREAGEEMILACTVITLADVYGASLDHLTAMEDPGWVIYHASDGAVDWITREELKRLQRESRT